MGRRSGQWLGATLPARFGAADGPVPPAHPRSFGPWPGHRFRDGLYDPLPHYPGLYFLGCRHAQGPDDSGGVAFVFHPSIFNRHLVHPPGGHAWGRVVAGRRPDHRRGPGVQGGSQGLNLVS